MALFGGAYYGGRLLHEKSVAKSVEQERDYRERIRNMVAPPIEVERLGENIFSRKQNLEQVLDSMQSDMQFVFGDNWKELFLYNRAPDRLNFVVGGAINGFGSIFHIAYWMWITKQGYADGSFHHISKINPYFGIDEVPSEKRAEVAIKACFVMEKNMQTSHPEYSDCFRFVRPLYDDTGKNPHYYPFANQLNWAYTLSRGVRTLSLWERLSDGTYLFNFGIPGTHEPLYQKLPVN